MAEKQKQCCGTCRFLCVSKPLGLDHWCRKLEAFGGIAMSHESRTITHPPSSGKDCRFYEAQESSK